MKKTPLAMTGDLFSSAQRNNLRQAYQDALASLNPLQRAAVEDIDGPVMVLAGPGTGKTQVLAARFGYILENTDTSIRQILCLTYSEAGVQAMRDRLMQFIGPAAHEAQIFTFHAFCNKIIQDNPEYFYDFKRYKLASVMERFELIEELLLSLPDEHILKRIIGDRHFDIRRLSNQYDQIKKEEIDIPKKVAEINDHISKMSGMEEFFYKKRTGTAAVGDPKPTYALTIAKYRRAIDAMHSFYIYDELMHKKHLIDFNDMLIWVKNAFNEQADLLAKYQETYQYFLVDEFQDNNTLQSNILLQICDYWDAPNLFVVGDDDQAIYRFQGADEQNLISIINKYQDIKVHCITENYRSSQEILDAANKIIQPLLNRITNLQLQIRPEILNKINKQLIAHAGNLPASKPELLKFNSAQEETLGIFNFIQNTFIYHPHDLSNIAIIYRKHKTAADLIYLCELAGIPLNLNASKDMFDEPLIQHIILLLQYLQAEYNETYSGEPYLIQLMYLPYFGLNLNDIAQISFLERKNRETKYLKDKIINDEIWADKMFANREKIKQFIHLTQNWLSAIPPVKTLSILVEDILRESGLLAWAIQSKEQAWHLRSINAFFGLIKDESNNNPGLTLDFFLSRLNKMLDLGVNAPIPAGFYSGNGVHFITAHGSKGKEFDQVWIMNCTYDQWEKSFIGGEQPYAIPKGIRQIEQTPEMQEHDERRLFYVCMTRARKALKISWSNVKIDGKNTSESKFITELRDDLISVDKHVIVPEELLKTKLELIQNKSNTPPELINHQLINQFLEGFVLNCTELDTYLECPRKFYFEQILKVPNAPNAHMGLGLAIHEALTEFFNIYLHQKGDFDIQYLVDGFSAKLNKYNLYFSQQELEGLRRKFTNKLPLFFAQHQNLWSQVTKYKLEYFIDRINYQGIPLNGKLDQILHYSDRSIIIDFKSGQGDSSSSNTKLKTPKGTIGGNYWRQAVFYKILADHDPRGSWSVQDSHTLFLQPNKLTPDLFLDKSYTITSQDIELVTEQIKNTYHAIQNHEFDTGCEKPECDWCNYVKNRQIIIKREDIIY